MKNNLKILTSSQHRVNDLLKSLNVGPSKIALIRITSEKFIDLDIEIPDENVIMLDFADIEENEYERLKKEYELLEKNLEENTGRFKRFSPITKDEACSIIKFINDIINKGINTLIIHCDEGKSRSRSLAIAISEYILNDLEQAKMYKELQTTRINKTIIYKIKETVKNECK